MRITMKNKLIKGAAVTAMLFSAAFAAIPAFAQTATMPVLYNSVNQPANTSGGTLPAGNYTDASGHQIYYYGNGTYYDSTTQTYGGSIYNPSGAAGASLNYDVNNSAVTGTTPGVPNTGAGGSATATWLTLAIAGLVVLGGSAYVTYTGTRKANR